MYEVTEIPSIDSLIPFASGNCLNSLKARALRSGDRQLVAKIQREQARRADIQRARIERQRTA